MSEAVTVEAPAKVNLALHVVGRRPDGYHDLDMLVAFARAADLVTVAPAESLSLEVAGPFAAALGDGDNLVLAAARRLAARLAAAGRPAPGARIRLVKNLPVASGIGGGSADAAAALVALDRLWGAGLAAADLAAEGLALGADVPMCLAGRPARVRGIGERVEPIAPLPAHGLLLVNPGVPLATPAVFRRMERRENPPLPDPPPVFADAAALAGYLAGTRNDLTAPAVTLAPGVAEVLARLAAEPACRLARMSGSGATCFGLFDDPARAETAAAAIAAEGRGWWVAA